jgi:hypothetical protein
MATFNLQIFEDQLLNRDQLISFLKQTPKEESIILSTSMEGPSLHQCGVVAVLIASGRDLNTVRVDTPNYYERLPIKHVYQEPKWNHWFQYCRHAVDLYKFKSSGQSQARLGCFVGRKNLDRLAILYWISRRYKCFLSSLREDQITYEHRSDLESWVDSKWSFEEWVRNFNIPSIDDHRLEDQYKSIDFKDEKNQFLQVQLNMLNWYGSFDVEIVCETFVRGQTYFPTEKTIRPIIGSKPMLIYGPKNFLANLKSQGFKTWGDFWDESYDQYEGLERWERMKPIINQINAWGDWEWTPILDKAKQIAEYNREHFLKEVSYDY